MQPMDLVDEKNIAVLKVGNDRGKVARLFDDRASRGAQCRAHLIRHDVRKRRFAYAGRSSEENMIQRLTPLQRRLHKHAQVVLYLLLADVLRQLRRPERRLE